MCEQRTYLLDILCHKFEINTTGVELQSVQAHVNTDPVEKNARTSDV
jgi:hypothetical protein